VRGRWQVRVAELPCTIELGRTGVWIVVLASVSVARDTSLVTAIVRAGGGMIDVAEAARIARRVTESLTQQGGSGAGSSSGRALRS
jgi:hypothetical protein